MDKHLQALTPVHYSVLEEGGSFGSGTSGAENIKRASGEISKNELFNSSAATLWFSLSTNALSTAVFTIARSSCTLRRSGRGFTRIDYFNSALRKHCHAAELYSYLPCRSTNQQCTLEPLTSVTHFPEIGIAMPLDCQPSLVLGHSRWLPGSLLRA
jgi:hypothetical protein